jgi:hypothetical protein
MVHRYTTRLFQYFRDQSAIMEAERQNAIAERINDFAARARELRRYL